LDAEKKLAMLRQMVLLRAFEEKLEELYQRKAMFGSTHSYRGQEAIAVGVCAALEPTDLIASYHRGTGHLIAKGADLYTLLCECMGRADGYSKGRGGKMHMGDMGFGFLGNTGTVGGTVPTATGAALAAKIRGSKEIAVSFFGDGAVNQGVVHEAMNLAGVWKLPLLYVCENNQYAMTVSLEKSVAIKRLSDRAAAYGFEGKTWMAMMWRRCTQRRKVPPRKREVAAEQPFWSVLPIAGMGTSAATPAPVIAQKRKSKRGS
jgi:pyruvate dehydrogenase E1 component alpha subunit